MPFLILALLALMLPSLAQAQKKPPYWASIAPDKARMRTGPGRQFPASWLYQRAGLPVKVVEVYPNWRKIEDPDGTVGWVQANLLSEERSALVSGAIRDMRATADGRAAVIWRAEPGVVGKISQCANGWCLFKVRGRGGYIRTVDVWGVAPDERLP